MVSRTRPSAPIRSLVRLGACVALAALAGCGVLAARQTEFASQVETSEGRKLFVEDIEDIVHNELLTAEEKYERLGLGNPEEGIEGLGIEDEDLLAALLSL